MDQLLKIQALIDATGITRRTAIDWVNRGIVKGRKIGGTWFVSAGDLERLIST